MTITLPLDPQEEARIIELAKAKGLSANELVLEALHGLLADTPVNQNASRSLRGLWAKYGTAPSDEEIRQNRAEMLADFPRSH